MELVGGRIVAPSTPRCGDRINDFFVIAECLGHVAHKAYTIGDGTFYPHRPVRLLIWAKTNNKVVRQLKVPAGFGPVLPFGPSGKPKEVTEATVNQTKGNEGRCKNYTGHITNIEEELCCVEGLDEKEAALRSGRSKGVAYC